MSRMKYPYKQIYDGMEESTSVTGLLIKRVLKIYKGKVYSSLMTTVCLFDWFSCFFLEGRYFNESQNSQQA